MMKRDKGKALHNVSVRLNDDDYKKLIFLYDYYNSRSYSEVSLADVLRLSINSNYEAKLEETAQQEKELQQVKQLKEINQQEKTDQTDQTDNTDQEDQTDNTDNTDQTAGKKKIKTLADELLEKERQKAQKEQAATKDLNVPEIIKTKGKVK